MASKHQEQAQPGQAPNATDCRKAKQRSSTMKDLNSIETYVALTSTYGKFSAASSLTSFVL